MTEHAIDFDNAAAYEQFMGRWTRAAGVVFLDWLKVPPDARCLDVGCGTGVFTELLLDTCSPAVVAAVDPAATQIEHARRQPIGQRVDFKVADAQALPFASGEFDVVVSALVINFIPDRAQAMREMRRVLRAGGTVAAYVWDFAHERSPGGILRHGLREIGVEPPDTPGTAHSTLEALNALFEQAGFLEIESRTIDVTSSFDSFDDLWRAQTPSFNPLTKTVASLSAGARERIKEHVRAGVVHGDDGRVTYSARANAIKGRVAV